MTHENDTTTIKMLEPIPSHIEIVTVEPPVEKMNSIVSGTHKNTSKSLGGQVPE